MLKKFISSLIIFSLFYTDVANAMQSEDLLFHDATNLSSRPSPLQHTRPLRRIRSSEDFSASQGQKNSIPQDALLSTSSTHNNEFPPKGLPLSSPTGSERRSDDEDNSPYATTSIGSSDSSQGSSPSKNSNDSPPQIPPFSSPTGSLKDEALDPLASAKRSLSSLQDEVGFSLEERGSGTLPRGEEQKESALPLAIVANHSAPPELSSAIVANHSAPPPMDLPESDQEGEGCVSLQGSIQDFSNIGSGFSLKVFSSSSERKDRDHLTERSPLLRQSASLSSVQELRSTNTEQRDSRELLIVRAKGAPSLLQEGEATDLISARLLEEGQQSNFQHFLTKVKQLKPDEDTDRRTMAFLTYAKQHIVDGKFTWRQGLGGIGGILIGIGVGNAMPAILSDGLSTIGSDFDYELGWNVPIADTFITHTAITLGIDSISRNIMIIGDLVGPSTEEFSISGVKLKYKNIGIDLRKGTLLLVYACATFAALLPVYYLWSVEEKDIKYDSGQNKTQYLAFFWCLAPTLWLDSLFTNGRAAKELVDEKFNNWAIRRAFSDRLSPEYALRQQELKRFKELERFFKYAPNEDINDLYEQVLVNGFKIKKNGIGIPEDTIKTGDALRTLKVLRSIHADSQLPEEVKETWKHVVSEICGWGLPLAATVGRSLVFYTIISHLLGDIGLDHERLHVALSVIFGGFLASLFQGKVEKDSVKTGVYELLNGEETEGDASHSCIRSGARKVGKGYNYLQGAWNTLPYVLVGIAATSGWPVVLQAITLFFFGVADMFNNTLSFHESYRGVINGGENLLSYGYATTSYKRNKLVRLVQRYRLAYETMTPGVLMKMDTLLSNEEMDF